MSIARVPPTAKSIIVSTRYCMPTTLWSVVNLAYLMSPPSLPARYISSSWVRSLPSSQRNGPTNAPTPIRNPIAQATRVTIQTASSLWLPSSRSGKNALQTSHAATARTSPMAIPVNMLSRRMMPPPDGGASTRTGGSVVTADMGTPLRHASGS